MRSALLVVAAALVAVLLGVLPARGEEETVNVREKVLREVRDLLESADTYAAAEHVQEGVEPAVAAPRYEHVVTDLYWKAKDLPGCLALGRSGVAYCLTMAQRSGDAETGAGLRGAAQRLAFNLASFTWTGWDEAGIAIGPAEQAAGLDFARLDLRLVQELGYPPQKVATAHWIVGAQLMAVRRLDEAAEAFARSRDVAREAGNAAGEWPAGGYAGIVAVLASPDDPAAGRARVDAAAARLNEIGTDDSRFYASQLGDVLAVFTRR